MIHLVICLLLAKLDCVLCTIADLIIVFFFRKGKTNYYLLKKKLDIEAFYKKYPASEPFCDLLKYAKGLEFEEKPDYKKMRDRLNGEYLNLKGKSTEYAINDINLIEGAK